MRLIEKSLGSQSALKTAHGPRDGGVPSDPKSCVCNSPGAIPLFCFIEERARCLASAAVRWKDGATAHPKLCLSARGMKATAFFSLKKVLHLTPLRRRGLASAGTEALNAPSGITQAHRRDCATRIMLRGRRQSLLGLRASTCSKRSALVFSALNKATESYNDA